MADEIDTLEEIAERERRAGIEAVRKAAAEPRPLRFACADGCGDSVDADSGRVRCAYCHDRFLRKQAWGR